MVKNKNLMVLAVTVLIAWTGRADDINGININFEPIGNANNAADSTGYGAVDYNYRIGRTEVSIEQFQASGISDSNADYWNDGTRNVGPDAPVVSVSWHEAARYCNWLTSSNANVGAYTISGGLVTAIMSRSDILADGGLFYVLPTEDEWYKAAYFTGAGYSLYANGTGTDPIHGVDANFAGGGNYFTGPAWRVVEGSFEQNGTRNMMGNVWEWLESPDDGTFDTIGEEKAFRGGDYFQGVGKLASTGRGTGELPTEEYYNTGLRIVAIPEPGTISLMGLSTISLFATRRIRRRKLAGKSLLPVRAGHRCDTFETMEPVEEDADYLVELKESVKAQMSVAWGAALACYHEVDKVFWNRMVVVHERRVARKTAFRQALKKKVLDGFDAFLALIMK